MNLNYKKGLICELFNIFKEGTFFGVIIYIIFKSKIKFFKIFNILNRKNSKSLALVGAGSHQVSINLPCAIKSNFFIDYIFTNGSISSHYLSNLLKYSQVQDKLKKIIRSDAVLIGSPHNLHPKHLKFFSNKNIYIYCEKPVAIDQKGIDLLKSYLDNKKIMVGFNRRFAPLIIKLKKSKIFSGETLEINYYVNFGNMVNNSLTDLKIGGGRLIGTCCHYVDLISYICESEIEYVSAFGSSKNNEISENNFTSIFKLKNGSVANLNFTSSGNRKIFPKESIYISGGGNLARIYNFETLYLNKRKFKNYRNSYGSLNAWKKFYNAVSNNLKTEITLADGIKATEITLAIKKSLNNNGKIQKL